MEQPSYYSILTADVRYDPRLKNHADCKVLYSEITALSNKTGYCHASNSYFAKLYNRPVPTISKWINLLKEFGYLKVEMIRDGKQIKERHIYPISTPINANINTYSRKHEGGINADVKPPINVNVKENITSINTTSKNKDDDDQHKSDNPFDLAYMTGINVNSGTHLPIFTDYISRLGNDLVCYAIQRTGDLASHPNWTYLLTILKSLEDNHVKTVQQAEELSAKRGQANKLKSYSRQTQSLNEPQYEFESHDTEEDRKQFEKELAEAQAYEKVHGGE